MTDTFGRGFELASPEPEPESQPQPQRVKFPAGFEAFFREHKDTFFRIAVNRLHDPRDADEALSDAALVMYRIPRFLFTRSRAKSCAHPVGFRPRFVDVGTVVTRKE